MRTIPLEQSPVEFRSNEAIRVLVSRMDTTSNSLLTLPVVCCLRDQFPNAYIGWATESNAASIVQGHPAIDEVIELPRRWYASLAGLRDARRALCFHRFDCVVDCQANSKSALAGYLSGAKRRIGFSGTRRVGATQEFSLRMNRWLYTETVTPVFHHITDCSLELLTPLGIHHPQIRWGMSIDPEDRIWAQAYRSKMGASRVAVLGPGASWSSQIWEADRFASTARYLADRYGYRSLVIWGTFEERLLAEEIVSLSEGTAALAPSTSLKTLAALIENADLFIGGDSDPLHLSVAVGTQVIGLYGATHFSDRGPYGYAALQMQYEEGSLRHRRRASNRAMQAIGVEHVCAMIDELHSKESARAA